MEDLSLLFDPQGAQDRQEDMKHIPIG
jgi:hypothetical protein